jgi:hypothetical protein
MRLLTPTTSISGDVHPQLPGYLAAMTGHCPYLGPSMDHDLTTWCSYEAGPTDTAGLLAVLVETAEDLRQRRRVGGPLVCANIAVFGPTDIASARAVLDWPHWITRKLYAPVQLMVGKFWIGEMEDDRHGLAIMPPPVSFFSLRHSVVRKDARFLHNLPGVAAQLAESHDDGRDVLFPWLGVPLTPDTVKQRYDELKAVFPAEQKVSP